MSHLFYFPPCLTLIHPLFSSLSHPPAQFLLPSPFSLSVFFSIPVSLSLPPTLGSSLMRLAAPHSKRRRPSIGCVIDMDFCLKWWKICRGYSQAISPGFSSQEGKRPQQFYNWYGDQFSSSGLHCFSLTTQSTVRLDRRQMKWSEEDV